MSNPFTIYNTTTREVIRCVICDAADLGLKEGEGVLDGWFDDIEHTVGTNEEGQAVAERKPQEEIDAYHAEKKSHMDLAESLNVDTTEVLAEALRQKGIDLTDEDLAAAKTNLQAQARIQVQEDQTQLTISKKTK